RALHADRRLRRRGGDSATSGRRGGALGRSGRRHRNAQAMTNTEIGRDGLRRLAAGEPVARALAALLGDDPLSDRRQIHGVDRAGAWAHTGADCKPWCGHRVDDGFTVAGNFLTGPDVLDAMATAFAYDPSAELGQRLVSALEAGQAAGRGSPRRPPAPPLLPAAP